MDNIPLDVIHKIIECCYDWNIMLVNKILYNTMYDIFIRPEFDKLTEYCNAMRMRIPEIQIMRRMYWKSINNYQSIKYESNSKWEDIYGYIHPHVSSQCICTALTNNNHRCKNRWKHIETRYCSTHHNKLFSFYSKHKNIFD